MPRIVPLERERVKGDVRAAFDEGLARWGRMTNMKRTLLHSPPAYHALMQWYTLFATVKEFLGERLAIIFAHAISVESDCLICTTYMRRILIEWGENPNELKLDEKAEVVMAFGRAMTQPSNRVPDALYRKLASFFNTEQIVALTAFGGLMIATNIINNVLEVDLDEYLYEYRDAEGAKVSKHGT
jgi:alkylhydroperoxidase family enzyme